MASKRRGDANNRAAVNMRKARILQIGRKASPDTPRLLSFKAPVSPAGAFPLRHLMWRWNCPGQRFASRNGAACHTTASAR